MHPLACLLARNAAAVDQSGEGGFCFYIYAAEKKEGKKRDCQMVSSGRYEGNERRRREKKTWRALDDEKDWHAGALLTMILFDLPIRLRLSRGNPRTSQAPHTWGEKCTQVKLNYISRVP